MMTFEEFIRDYEPVHGAEDVLYLMCSCSDGEEKFAQFAAQFPDLTVADLQQGVDEDVMNCVKSMTDSEMFGTYDRYFDLLCKHFGIDVWESPIVVWTWAVVTGVYTYDPVSEERMEKIACKVFPEYIAELKNPSKEYYNFCDCSSLNPNDTVNSHSAMYSCVDDIVFSTCYVNYKNFTAADVQAEFSKLSDYLTAHAPNLNSTNERYSRDYSFASAVGANIEKLAQVVSRPKSNMVIWMLQCPEMCSEEFVQQLHDAVISEATKEFDPLQYAKMRLKDLSKLDTDAIAKCKDAKECEALVSKYF